MRTILVSIKKKNKERKHFLELYVEQRNSKQYIYCMISIYLNQQPFQGKGKRFNPWNGTSANVFNNKVHYIISATVRGPDLSPNAANCQHRSADMLVRSVHPMFQKCFTKQMCVEEFNSKWISRISIMLNSLFIIFSIALHPLLKTN